mgnify:CR=1 FL=1
MDYATWIVVALAAGAIACGKCDRTLAKYGIGRACALALVGIGVWWCVVPPLEIGGTTIPAVTVWLIATAVAIGGRLSVLDALRMTAVASAAWIAGRVYPVYQPYLWADLCIVAIVAASAYAVDTPTVKIYPTCVLAALAYASGQALAQSSDMARIAHTAVWCVTACAAAVGLHKALRNVDARTDESIRPQYERTNRIELWQK